MGREETKIIYNERLFQILKTAFGEKINSLFEEQDVIEILLNNDKKIWVDTLSKGMYDVGITLENHSAMKIINTIATASGTIVDKNNSIISSELPDSGFRFEAVIPPNASNPIFAIRKSSVLIFTLDDYVEMGVITARQQEIIKQYIENYQNILIVGATSSGKTTFANACIQAIPETDRLVILEDTQEIRSTCPNTVSLKTSLSKSMEDLFYSTMRLRPTRIIVGEIRGATSINLLTAWNSGHGGGLSTIHSDSAEGALQQLEQYNQIKSVDKQQALIGKAIDLIVVLKKIRGKRAVVEIKKVIKFVNEKYILEEVE